jgi:hypothetical protein
MDIIKIINKIKNIFNILKKKIIPKQIIFLIL